MNQALTKKNGVNFHNNSEEDVHIIVAVGINGDAVLLNMLTKNEGLIADLKCMDIRTALWPTSFPESPGLYYLAGKSQLAHMGDPDTFSEMHYRCKHKKIDTNFLENSILRQGHRQ